MALERHIHTNGRVSATTCGCFVAGCCHSCPLPDCIWVAAPQRQGEIRQRLVKLRRNARIRRARSEGVPVEAVVSRYGVSRRQVFVIVKEHAT